LVANVEHAETVADDEALNDLILASVAATLAAATSA